MNLRVPKITLAGMVLFVADASLDSPAWNKPEQNTRTVAWLSGQRLTIAQASSRSVRITGPWMDYIAFSPRLRQR
jgi:hypothetical protein